MPTSQTDGTPLPVLDRESALERLGGDEEMLNEFMGMLLSQADSQLVEITAAIQHDNAGSLEHLAHDLKGAAASLGAERVRYVAHQLEIVGRSKNLSQAQPMVVELEQEIKLLHQTVGLS
jgi:HPt (histidine-containing phosphotransfer) domain-containing protein